MDRFGSGNQALIKEYGSVPVRTPLDALVYINAAPRPTLSASSPTPLFSNIHHPPPKKENKSSTQEREERSAAMHPRDLIGGLDLARQQATKAMVSAVSLAKPAAGIAGSGVGFMKRQATAMVSNRDRAVKTAAMVVGGSVGVYFLWPAAAVPAAAGTMKAPGAAGFLISRVAFQANPQLYFQILRTAGAAAAAAAFV